jgi:hypothetical protein
MESQRIIVIIVNISLLLSYKRFLQIVLMIESQRNLANLLLLFMS